MEIKGYELKDINNKFFEKIVSDINCEKTAILKLKSSSTLIEKLSEDYLKKEEFRTSAMFKRSIDRNNFKLGHGVVNWFYSTLLKIDKEKLEWKKGRYNKPFIENDNQYSFNISHTKGCVVIAFSKSSVGIDVELVNKNFDFKSIVEMFPGEEKNIINENPYLFYKFWVAKEAYMKLIGTGFNKSLNEIKILDGEKNIIKVEDKRLGACQDILIFNPYVNYISAVCIKGEEIHGERVKKKVRRVL